MVKSVSGRARQAVCGRVFYLTECLLKRICQQVEIAIYIHLLGLCDVSATFETITLVLVVIAVWLKVFRVGLGRRFVAGYFICLGVC